MTRMQQFRTSHLICMREIGMKREKESDDQEGIPMNRPGMHAFLSKLQLDEKA
jgi:hypothetical protein